MNIDSLKNMKIDLNALRNFSLEDVRNFVNEQQVLALNIVIALAALITGGFVIQMRVQEYVQLKQNLDEIVVKEEPAHRYEKLLKDKRAFIQEAPSSLSEEEVIPYLTQLADQHHVVINELQPPYESVEGFYREIRTELVCSVASFEDAMLFMDAIERSQYMIKINAWSFSLKGKSQIMEDPREKSDLSITLDISSMRLMKK